eukprot:CAMPEP_0181329004 /NCGR_PEP_ID=MMETSP1101-20121128/23064_1 /TAXON_ID=46948 /ORGANISM="Rhodomonas abbreviata, Strain Caron Lab Isolate" /LENGTH=159 /DNA_ID=CAMNT_0023438023 /DNA_START=64 /DNA_END=540 /DNA_ORIENTATION=+
MPCSTHFYSSERTTPAYHEDGLKKRMDTMLHLSRDPNTCSDDTKRNVHESPKDETPATAASAIEFQELQERFKFLPDNISLPNPCTDLNETTSGETRRAPRKPAPRRTKIQSSYDMDGEPEVITYRPGGTKHGEITTNIWERDYPVQITGDGLCIRGAG